VKAQFPSQSRRVMTPPAGRTDRPVGPRRLIERPALLLRLAALRGQPILTVIAPPGYGKTASVALWDDSDPRPFAWVRVDQFDDDASHLAQHIVTGLDAIAPVDERDIDGLWGIGRSIGEDLLPCLGRLLAARAPCVVVLDDVHLLRSIESLTLLDGLLEVIPTGSQVVLVGRQLSEVPLTRRRLEDLVASITTGDLVMTDDEVTGLVRSMATGCTDAEVQAMVARAEGWPAGLHLMARAARDDESASPQTTSGREHSVFDYFEEEVLAGLPDEVVRFLERSSVLDVLSGPALDDLLETEGSAMTLKFLEGLGTGFLSPLDGERHHYRYHGLFAEMLAYRLEMADPATASRLHRRCSEQMEAVGDVDGAVRHAIAARDFERAADLVLVHVVELVFHGQVDLLGHRIELLGDDAVDRSPAAAVATAWYGLATGDAPLVRRAAAAAAQADPDGRLADGSPSATVALTMVRAMAGLEGVPGVMRDTTIVRAAGDAGSNSWWPLATLVLGTAHSMLGDDDLARGLLESSLASIGDAPAFEACALAHLALLDLRNGDLTNAEREADRATAIAERHQLAGVTLVLPAFAIAALAFARAGRAADAEHAAAVASAMLERLGRLSPRTRLLCNLVLAQAALASGDRATARLRASSAEADRCIDGTATQLNDELDELVRQLDIGQDCLDYGLQLSPAELRVLSYLPTNLSLQEIADQLIVSRNTAKTHSVSIYRKLGAATRSEAVELARQMGILPELHLAPDSSPPHEYLHDRPSGTS
jgi:LuxR family transcriptional regulator, maltose regulon positive regulatory protein